MTYAGWFANALGNLNLKKDRAELTSLRLEVNGWPDIIVELRDGKHQEYRAAIPGGLADCVFFHAGKATGIDATIFMA